MADRLPDPRRVKEIKTQLQAEGVKYVLANWIDLLGVPKTKPMPLSEFEALCAGKGPQFAVHSVSFVPELGPADPDQVIVPDLDTLVICPWDPHCAWFIADLWWQDKPYNVCPRQMLRRTVEQMAAAGYVVDAGIEPEFIVMRWDYGRPVKAFDDDPQTERGPRPRRQAFGYDTEASIHAMGFLGELMDIVDELGWQLHDVVAEGAYSQFEMDFHYTDLLGMADRLVLFRMLVKQVAKRHNLFVTFMPKPTTADWRSGAHINHSIRKLGKDGGNIFQGADGTWAQPVFHAVGGLLRHGGALLALSCPTVNSYNGLVGSVPGLEGGTATWAPVRMTYGMNNRSAMLRLPQNRFCIENRAADLCMNPYLALAFTAAASLEGLRQGYDPGEPLNRDLYRMSEEEFNAAGARPLPRNLLEATEALQADPLAREVLGETMLQCYLRYKFDEWQRYSQSVTDWEVQEYLRFY